MIASIFPIFGLIFGLVFGAGCASPGPSEKSISRETGALSRENLFPLGLYRQKVKLRIVARGDRPEKSFQFDGLVQVQQEFIRVVVFSFFGTTAFKIYENRKTGEVKTDIYVAGMKQYEPKVRDYYSVMKLLLVAKAAPESESSGAASGLKWISRNGEGLPEVLESFGFEKNVTFQFKQFDPHRVPERIAILHPDFQVDIEVTGYEI